LKRTVTIEPCSITAYCEHCGERLAMRDPMVLVRYPAVRARPARTYRLHERCCQRWYPSCWEQLQEEAPRG
jgi:hypothetical protein